MKPNQAKVVFTPSGRRGYFDLGTPVLEAGRSLGVDIDSVCGGRGICRRCQISCVEGQFDKHEITSSTSNLSPRNAVENAEGKRRKPVAANRRLGCQATIQGDLVIDVPPESQMHRQVVRKQAEARDIVLDANVHLYYVEVREANMHDPSGDLERLAEALETQWQIQRVACDSAVLCRLQPALREGKWKITVAIAGGSRIIEVWPGFHERLLGAAIDLGSTTIAVHLCNLGSGKVLTTCSAMNPQIRYGEDLMSRVSYVMMHPQGVAEMTTAVRVGIQQLLDEAIQNVDGYLNEIAEIVIVGNPIMHHLFLGISPVELGGAPFALAVDQALDIPCREVGLTAGTGASVHMLPCIAGHVGADCAGVILSEQPYLKPEMTLTVDVGTNAEIVLGNDQRLLACSSPTGPAFEGAQISCGQRAAPGAIERVRIDKDTLIARVRVIGSDLWSNDPGFADSIAGFGVTGICGSGIIEVVAEMFLAGIIRADGVIKGVLSDQCPAIIEAGRTWSYVLYEGAQTITVSQNDIREIQLAKAALYAGIKLLMDKLEVDSVDRIRLAGAFGSHISVKHAMVLGLIPDCDLDQVSSAGNAAGTGARIALLNQQSRRTIQQVVNQVEKIETAIEPRFQEHFVAAMAFPHISDPFEILFSMVDKPAPEVLPLGPTNSGRRRRRRRSPDSAV